MEMTIILLIIAGVLLLGAIGTLLIIKQLDKEKVRVIIATTDRHLKTYKVKPKSKTVTVANQTFNINDNDFFLIKGMPTYVFSSDNTQPIDLFTGIQGEYGPNQYNSAIENRLIEEIFKTSNKKGNLNESPLTTILLFVIIGAVGIIGYLGYDYIEAIMVKLDTILEAMRNIGLEV